MDNILHINYRKEILKNGLQVILVKDENRSSVAINIWYKVGSAYDFPTKSGLAHLFEHMMFQGSENVAKEEHFRYIQETGGQLNASTSLDRTNYFETLPPNALELALWLESDRMGFLIPALNQTKLTNQIEVVSNERLQNYDNAPYGLSWELIMGNVFPENHPYHTPTIGYLNEIQSYTLDDVRSFFEKFYSPQNASLVIAGNFDEEKTFDLVKKYFEEIPNKHKIEQPVFPEWEIQEDKQVIHQDNIEFPRIYIVWKSVKNFHSDDSSLDVLADVLSSTKNSKLHKKLVYELQIAVNVAAFQYSMENEGLFVIMCTAKMGVELSEIKRVIFEEIEELIQNGVEEEELIVSKNSIRSSFVWELDFLQHVANKINNYNCTLNEPDSFNYDLQRYSQLKTEDIQNVTKKYITKKYFELCIVPKEKENDK